MKRYTIISLLVLAVLVASFVSAPSKRSKSTQAVSAPAQVTNELGYQETNSTKW